MLPFVSHIIILFFQFNTKTPPATSQASDPEEKGECGWARLLVEVMKKVET